MNPEIIRLIEEASLNAWPSLQQHLYDGWVLRFSNGYTKRANSINPLYEGKLDLEKKIEHCEDIYGLRSLPPIFRLTTPFAPHTLDTILTQRGYQKIDPTWVMVMDLATWQPGFSSVSIERLDIDDWMDLFITFSGYNPEKQSIHQKMLGQIQNPVFAVSRLTTGEPVSCGLGVLQGRLFGMFDIVTNSNHRNRGYGQKLVAGLLREAQNQGADISYLQVMEINSPARYLYSKIGYQDVYHYWYRVPREGKKGLAI